MKILLTNDDGIYAPGITALSKYLSSFAEIFMVAPDSQRSGTAHAITVFDPIRVQNIQINGVKDAWMIQGTPADCVKLALSRLLPEKPDLVISGINQGSNLGTDVLYSGTFSAAAESMVMGVPAIAVSLDSFSPEADYSVSAKFILGLVKLLAQGNIEKTMLLNVNIPAVPTEEITGIKVSKLGIRSYNNIFDERKDPRGNLYFWMGGELHNIPQEENSDIFHISQNFISVTPINLDLTNYGLMNKYETLIEKNKFNFK